MNIKSFVLHNGRQLGTFLGLIILIAIFQILTGRFLNSSNLLTIANQASINAVIAAGMTFVIITKGIDLSVGSIMAFSGVVLASASQTGMSLPVLILIGLGVGFAVGMLNGFIISYGKITPFIVTLGMMSIARGGATLYKQKVVSDIQTYSDAFLFIGNGKLLGIPFLVAIMIFVFIISAIVLSRTKFGRYTYAIGGNEEAATLSGIRVKMNKAFVYGLSGLLAGLAAIMHTAKHEGINSTAGDMYELNAIAAVVIGGTSLFGGQGKLSGTLIGALIMAVLNSGLVQLGVDDSIKKIMIGSVIVLAVFGDQLLKRK